MELAWEGETHGVEEGSGVGTASQYSTKACCTPPVLNLELGFLAQKRLYYFLSEADITKSAMNRAVQLLYVYARSCGRPPQYWTKSDWGMRICRS